MFGNVKLQYPYTWIGMYVAGNFNCNFKTERLLKLTGTGSHIHCKRGCICFGNGARNVVTTGLLNHCNDLESDLQGNSPTASLFKYDFSYSCAENDKISTDSLSRGPPSIAELVETEWKRCLLTVFCTQNHLIRLTHFHTAASHEVHAIRTQLLTDMVLLIY